MRTSHSTLGVTPIDEAAVAAFPVNLTPVLILAERGPEAELLVRLLDSHSAVCARSEEPLSSARTGHELRSAMATFAIGASQDASMSLRRGAASPLRVVGSLFDPAGSASLDAVVGSLHEARVICLLRDGRDVVVNARLEALRAGCFTGLSPAAKAIAAVTAEDLFGRGGAPARLFCAESLRLHTMRWIASLRGVFRSLELLPDRTRVLRYEDLLLETIRSHAAMCRWLGVAGDAARVHSGVEACRGAIAASPRPGAWRQRMSEGDRTGFKRMAGELLIELGYEKDTRW